MIGADRTLLVLLAAGQSRRFGALDKLMQPLEGKAVALHAVKALKPIPFLARVAIVADTDLDFGALGYRVIINPAPEDGMSGSVRLGVAAALEMGASAVLIALADMPRVGTMHFFQLLDTASRADSVVASSDGAQLGPPALFAAGRFAELAAAIGDQGGRDLIGTGVAVRARAGELIDIDTPEQLARAQQSA